MLCISILDMFFHVPLNQKIYFLVSCFQKIYFLLSCFLSVVCVDYLIGNLVSFYLT